MQANNMNKKVLVEILRRIVKKTLAENAPAPAPSRPKEKPDVAEPPAETPDKQEPRRRIGNPDKVRKPGEKPIPNPKAEKGTMKEAEVLSKIVKRFKSKK